MQINMYLLFNGNCEEAMNYYKEALGGKIDTIVRYSDAPMPYAEDQKDKIMHGILNIDGTQIYFSDSGAKANVTIGTNFSISLSFKSDEEIKKAFNALTADGGKITMPLQDTFWGAKFGTFTDKFGINWMFNWDKPKD
jgi:PhnB protein